MKQVFSLLTAGVLVLSMTGCARITSQVVEKPRVDQELTGNRGYLAGSAAAPAPNRKRTRQIVQTDIEMPTAQELNPWRVRASAGPGQATAQAAAPSAPAPAPSSVWPSQPKREIDRGEIEGPGEPEDQGIAPASTPYTVRKGDTLEKIAAKVYGDSSQWRRIYKANPEKLKSPNRVYPGQELTIPPAGEKKGHRHTVPQSDIK